MSTRQTQNTFSVFADLLCSDITSILSQGWPELKDPP